MADASGFLNVFIEVTKIRELTRSNKVTKVRYTPLKKCCGQFHGIDALLPHRPAGNFLVWCPACPEPGFNSDPNCLKTPSHLRHLNQSQRTLDGNHQCNQFSKNTDPDDVSLCAGNGYFPLDSVYQEYLKAVPNSTEKSTCNYLKVVNKQDKKKFKNMALTGTSDSPTPIMLWRWRSEITNLGLVLEFNLQIEVDDVDEVTTYDIACEYFVNLEKRFKAHFPDQGHQDSCTYLFGTAYMECIGHFHGETAEHYWPEANQLGPHVRQMNLGHRQDTIINHHGDWNHKKTMKLASALAEDIQEAKQKYLLNISFKDRVPEWRKMSRAVSKVGKDAVSVYKHHTMKGISPSPLRTYQLTRHQVPSQQAIYDKMIAEESNFGSTLIPKNKIAQFLEHGLRIQESQRKLKNLIRDTDEHELQSRKKEITSRTSKLKDQLAQFWQEQKHLILKVGDKVAIQTVAAPAIYNERLYLPSDLSQTEREAMGITKLALEEALIGRVTKHA
ncbi:hypothetical protein C8F04DRAFT_1202415 [Mycena alexandri]|uniref:Uncharacterized protein n=1 Tax=Mycena alexandri TaxID=1745969 RepID=A0AAD6RWY2_9AGAR|nr:hypothetical protein C8F04DRAFT_1202415 [Mycena alexandri]